MQPFSAEHIAPRSQGGKTNLANLAWACQGCKKLQVQHIYSATPSCPRSFQQKLRHDAVCLEPTFQLKSAHPRPRPIVEHQLVQAAFLDGVRVHFREVNQPTLNLPFGRVQHALDAEHRARTDVDQLTGKVAHHAGIVNALDGPGGCQQPQS